MVRVAVSFGRGDLSVDVMVVLVPQLATALYAAGPWENDLEFDRRFAG